MPSRLRGRALADQAAVKFEPDNRKREPGQNGEPIADAPGTVAMYIASMADELSQLAKRSGLEPLAFILDMARIEADEASKRPEH